jgi:hypothetical protein
LCLFKVNEEEKIVPGEYGEVGVYQGSPHSSKKQGYDWLGTPAGGVDVGEGKIFGESLRYDTIGMMFGFKV